MMKLAILVFAVLSAWMAGCGDRDFEVLHSKDLLILTPRQSVLSQSALTTEVDGGTRGPTFTIASTDTNGRPREAAHVNVMFGSCGQGNSSEPADANSDFRFIGSTECEASGSGFLQCVLATDGSASFAVSLAAADGGTVGESVHFSACSGDCSSAVPCKDASLVIAN